MKVLVADDSDVIRQMITKYLAEMGITDVDQAADGAQALFLAKKNRYDLLLLDWNMPKMLGIDILRRLRGSRVETPVAIVTTETSKQSVLEAIRAGANGYVVKPLRRDAFISRVRELLRLTD